jgi:hypothetical protein
VPRRCTPTWSQACTTRTTLEPQREQVEEQPAPVAVVTYPDALDVAPARRAPQLTAVSSREELLADLRAQMRKADLGKPMNTQILEAFIWRYGGDGCEGLAAMALEDLRTGVEQLRIDAERHGLATALRDLTEWAPNPIESELTGPERTPTAA